MNKIKTSKLIELSASTVMLLGIVLVVTVGGASAKAHKLKGLVLTAKWSLTSNLADYRMLTWK